MATAHDSQPLVVCFGELLWDVLPEGLFPGGAPFNVAYHLSRHGCTAHLASAVGTDELGDELRRRVAALGLETASIRRQPHKPTGIVRAALNASGEATYDIVRNVAWDGIEPGGRALAATKKADALVFGSLAQRTYSNQRSLERLIDTLPDEALRIFDVNLRHPFVDRTHIRRLAQKASLIKVNSTEAAFLSSNENDKPGKEEKHARILAERSGCPSIVVTAGARGAGWLLEDEWIWAEPKPIKVIDTIGAGDAFLAALLAGMLNTPATAPAKLLAAACRRGEWVAKRRGATPAYA